MKMLKRDIAWDTSLFLSAYKSDVLNPESICNQSGVLSSLDRRQLLTAISSLLFVKTVLVCSCVML